MRQQPRFLESPLTLLLPSTGATVFHGTVTFEGAKGGKIAPLLVQMNWRSMTAMLLAGNSLTTKVMGRWRPLSPPVMQH